MFFPTGFPFFPLPYNSGGRNLCCLGVGSNEFTRAISAAHSGVEALVPPFDWGWPTTIRSYMGSPARAATSGTTRPSMPLVLMDLTLTLCHAGRGKTALTPPPLEPPPLLVRRPGASHHTTSFMAFPFWISLVPPTPIALGLELGK